MPSLDYSDVFSKPLTPIKFVQTKEKKINFRFQNIHDKDKHLKNVKRNNKSNKSKAKKASEEIINIPFSKDKNVWLDVKSHPKTNLNNTYATINNISTAEVTKHKISNFQNKAILKTAKLSENALLTNTTAKERTKTIPSKVSQETQLNNKPVKVTELKNIIKPKCQTEYKSNKPLTEEKLKLLESLKAAEDLMLIKPKLKSKFIDQQRLQKDTEPESEEYFPKYNAASGSIISNYNISENCDSFANLENSTSVPYQELPSHHSSMSSLYERNINQAFKNSQKSSINVKDTDIGRKRKAPNSINSKRLYAEKRKLEIAREEEKKAHDKAIPCSFFKRLGYCNNGDSCRYSHDIVPDVQLQCCKYYMMRGECLNKTCMYIHEEWPCKFYYLRGRCKNGDSCRFSHKPPHGDIGEAFLLSMQEERSMSSSNNNVVNDDDTQDNPIDKPEQETKESNFDQSKEENQSNPLENPNDSADVSKDNKKNEEYTFPSLYTDLS